ncbi:MAG: serine protease [Rhodanobacteraceae bacterium]|jgi:NTE family protein|nr:serine protease [Rhodanobacteraceae bacterium]
MSRDVRTGQDEGLSISLVLGSGGARGYAHIGVIEELQAQGLAIRSIAGSSMGALVGGIYAAGKLDVYRDWVRPLQRYDVLRLLDLTLSGGGFIKGDRIIGVLRELIGDTDIEELPIPYTAVAVDLDAQREVWFSRGPLFDAIRASIAIPTVFRPYRHQGRLLVDGGLLNPLPVLPTLRDLTDATIAVDVNAPAEPQGPIMAPAERAVPELPPADPPQGGAAPGLRRRLAELVGSLVDKRAQPPVPAEPGTLELIARSLDVVQGTITRLKLAAQPPDLLITVPRNACTFYEFHRADELIEIGRQRAREALAQWHRAAPR